MAYSRYYEKPINVNVAKDFAKTLGVVGGMVQVVIMASDSIGGWRGKGQVQKNGESWSKNWPFYAKRISILRTWEIWPAILRDDSTEYTINVGMDPEDDKKKPIDKMALNSSASGVEFPTAQEPILREATHLIGNERVWGSQAYRYASPPGKGPHWFIIHPSSGKIYVNVYTKYASGCKVDITATETPTVGFNQKLSEMTYMPITGNETKVDVPIKAPPTDDYYELEYRISLKDSSGKEVKTITLGTVCIANQKYIDGLKS